MDRSFVRALGLVLVVAAAACTSSPAGAGTSAGAGGSGSVAGPSSATSEGAPSVPPATSTAMSPTSAPSAAGSAPATAACIEKNAYDAYMKGPTSIETTSTPFVWDAFAYGLQHYNDPATSTWRTQLATALQKRDVKTADAMGADLLSGTMKLSRCP